MAGGETIGRPAVAGIAAVVVGGLLVSMPARDASGARNRGSPDGRAGALWAMAACVGYGVQFWVQGRFAAPRLGAVVSVGIYYAVSTLALALAAVIRRPALALSSRDAASVLGTGAVLGFVALSAGLSRSSAPCGAPSRWAWRAPCSASNWPDINGSGSR